MDSDVMFQLENSHLQHLLLRQNNFSVLEELLHEESQKLERLRQLGKEGRLDLGNRLKRHELNELFPKVCKEVDDFLGVIPPKMPKFGYFSFFDPGLTPKVILLLYGVAGMDAINAVTAAMEKDMPTASYFGHECLIHFIIALCFHKMVKSPQYNVISKRITLAKLPRAALIPLMGHEYTHHILKNEGSKYIRNSMFEEGCGRGVERKLSRDYCQRENNEAFLYQVLDFSVGELKTTYMWVGKKLKKPVRTSLLKTLTSRDYDETFHRYVFRKPTKHAIGNAALWINEIQYGENLYKDLLNNKITLT